MKTRSNIPIAEVIPEQTLTVMLQSGDLASSPKGKYIAAYAPESRFVTLLSESDGVRQIELTDPVSGLCLAVNATGSLIAFFTSIGNRLCVFNMDSNQVIVAKQQHEYVSVRFDEKGRLWAIHKGRDQFIVRVYAIHGWKMLGQLQVGDSYYLDGGAELRAGLSDDTMFVSIYSGQGEQLNYFCELHNGELSSQEVSSMEGNDESIFAAPDSQAALVLDYSNCKISLFEYPFSKSSADLKWPYFSEDSDGCEDERPGYYGCYLDEAHFLAGSSEGRLYLISTKILEVKKEIQIQGYAPVAASVKYPMLSDACGYVSALRHFGRFGDSLAFFFDREDGSQEFQVCILPITVFVSEVG